jgi:hypothetical protein
MTIEAQNIAIAKILGWEFCERAPTRNRKPLPWTIPHVRHHHWTSGIWRKQGRLPSYTHDLNAMHEAEKMLLVSQWSAYTALLQATVYHCIHATAAQRAESFLKTMNLWEES